MKKEKDRVKKNTSERRNRILEAKTLANIEYYSSQNRDILDQRLEKLNREWDIERILELNAGTLALTGVILASRDKRWLALSGFVTAFLVQHAVQGWCPPVPLFRALGFRTRREIERERYTLKVLRGDFENSEDVDEVWESAEM